jgi:hypothetical protein
MDQSRSVLTVRAALGAAVMSAGMLLPAHSRAQEARPIPTTWITGRTTPVEDVDPVHYQSLRTVQPGNSSAAMRKEALAELSLNGLSFAQREKAARVLGSVGLFRRLPTLDMEADPEVYAYLLSHPDVAVSTWRAMEISKFQLRPTAAGVYHADAGDGSVGTVEVWRSNPQETLIYCDGAFKSPLLARPIVARSIMRLKTRCYEDARGMPRVEHTGDVFVEFPSQTVDTVARLVSPVSHLIADRNFRQLTLYAHLMSQAMSRQPGWVATIARRMDSSDAQRTEFLAVAARAREATERREDALVEPLPVEEILAPLRAAIEPVRSVQQAADSTTTR